MVYITLMGINNKKYKSLNVEALFDFLHLLQLSY